MSFNSGHPTAHWPERGEQEFRETPIYRDVRGYVWQRLRNGHWHSTDGLDAGPGPSPPDARWAPYTMLTVVETREPGERR